MSAARSANLTHSQLSRGIVPGVAESNRATCEFITARQSTAASDRMRKNMKTRQVYYCVKSLLENNFNLVSSWAWISTPIFGMSLLIS
jgi:hypothetical protein